MRTWLFVFLLFGASFNVYSKTKVLKYSQAADVFELLSNLSSELGSSPDGEYYRYWKKNLKFSFDDKKNLNRFREIRLKYLLTSQDFDKFSLAFYRAKSVDGALKNLKKVVKKDEFKDLVEILKAIRPKASKIISESTAFKGKISEYEKALKKEKVFKAYTDTFKFFGLNKKLRSKIYFVWSPSKKPQISFRQNIVFISINPLANLQVEVDKKVILSSMVESLFYALGSTHKRNFEKVIFPSCSADNFYKILSYVLGPLHLEKLKAKKKFDPIKRHFVSSRDNLTAILFSNAFEAQLAKRSKFQGQFQNQLKFICEEVNSIK